MSNTVGRPVDEQREAWRMRFNLPESMMRGHRLPTSLMNQLSKCRSDVERRLILGVSEQYDIDDEERPPLITNGAL